MDKSLKEHIGLLEQRLRQLSEQIMKNREPREVRNRVEAEIRAAELALAHYRAAFELEKTLIR